MRCLNYKLRKIKLVGRTEFIFPAIYSCSSIEDFLNNKNQITPKKSLLPALLFSPDVYLHFSNPLVYHRGKNKETGILSDKTGRLIINLDDLSPDEISNLVPESTLFSSKFTYDKKNDALFLYNYDLSPEKIPKNCVP